MIHKPLQPQDYNTGMFIPAMTSRHTLIFAAAAGLGLLTLAPTSHAKDQKGGKGKEKGHGAQSRSHQEKGHAQTEHHANPNQGFKLYQGNGHAGKGYYYGPPNASYFSAGPGVRYFPNHSAIPREFYDHDAYRMNSDDARVQQALARLGYYQGSVDGRFGPQSMRAMNQYQQSQGQQATDAITALLLRSLGLQ